jgi:lysozyme
MQLSDEGLRLIRSFEGYHTRLPDGGCAAYLCPANVPTIGYGVTEGVKMGMVWTAEEAEAALRRELAKHEAAVRRLVTVDLNQNEFDALVSFSYNCGAGALGKSTLLKRLNAGDRLGAASQFSKWTRGGGRVLKGLVSRRDREAALFLKPTESPEVPHMPQEVSEVREISRPVATGAGVAAGTGAAVAFPSLPYLPPPPDLSQYTAWQSFGQQAGELVSWVSGNILLTIACGSVIAFFTFLPKIKDKLSWARSSLSS